MSKKVIQSAFWFLLGMLAMGIVVWFSMPSMMIVEHRSPLNYEQTIKALEEAIAKDEHWKVAKEFDFQKNIRDAGHAADDQIGSITLCQPTYASRILDDGKNRKVTALMPLGIGVYEDNQGQVYISELNVGMMGMMFGGTISEVMSEAGTDVKKLISDSTVQ